MDDSDRPVRPEFLDASEHADAPRVSLGLAYLRLFRLPNVFTAIADVLMGYFITTGQLAHWPTLLLLVLASAFLYTAGMVLNDVFDLEVDRQERPQRPLPSGQISWPWARWLGFQLLAMGVVCGWLAGYVSDEPVGPGWRSGLIATALAAAILLYDAGGKRTMLGPWLMGSCRFLNVLLGMSVYAVVVTDEPQWLGFGTSHGLIAAGIGLYIVGVTRFARSEATQSARTGLAIGIGFMAAGICLLAFFPRWHPASFSYHYELTKTWPLAILMISVWVLRRAFVALLNPGPQQVQAAVKNCILSLIVLDALVCSLIADSSCAMLILALLIPSFLLGRIIYST